MSRPLVDQYQGAPTLCLNPDDRFKLSFGLKKAKMILDHLDAIRAFVASEGKTCSPETMEGSRVSLDDLLNGRLP